MEILRESFNGNSSLPVHSRKLFERPQLISSPKHEEVPTTKRRFGDEPRITSGILPPTILPNSTRLRLTPSVVRSPPKTDHVEVVSRPTLLLDNLPSTNNETLVESKTSKIKSQNKTTDARPATTPKITGPLGNDADFGDVVSSFWKKMKQMLGFSPPCHNGGHKNLRGVCECPRYFEGELCEKIICVNNGTKYRNRQIPSIEMCKCPHPRFISGNHCEFVHCQNGGKDLGNGTCRCVDGWYSGEFCESYASSWLVVGVPLICFAIVFFCCIVCRLDLCPRSRRDRERRRDYGNYHVSARRTYANSHRHQSQILSHPVLTEQARMMQENLLNDAAAVYRRNARTRNHGHEASSVTVPTVYRLEDIPTYNPDILNNPEYKLDCPPPSYEQATRYPTIVQSSYHPNVSGTLPEYSPPQISSQTQLQNSDNENG